MSQGYTETDSKPEHGSGHITFIGQQIAYAVSGEWDRIASTSYPLYSNWQNVSNTQNDQCTYRMWLSKGTYTLSVIAIRNTNGAIQTVLLDGSSVGTIDWYGTLDYDNIQTLTGITVSTTGIHELSFQVATRHASSTGWYLRYSTFAMFRTA